jgi:hypothetical protein
MIIDDWYDDVFNIEYESSRVITIDDVEFEFNEVDNDEEDDFSILYQRCTL